ncbi:DUF1993 domain-containing protein [Xinfangfangia sp. CPCC 101601]|uniref:DUF1993 domain-containing protein n=1 Tax=Pseudogemmobacter lacusdianii TaxID=3069608 RepID=A0ABU0VSX1_9RHOB|nr:DUF1993 domain-containing protein [Xinfangfangia sp. CPCC 101601]MDQ2064820.1 DUF1993 domain-containing protein [Xinfangfangia sp. CPCC 101601]
MMHALSVLTFDRFLAGLSGLLSKAEAHCEARKITPDAILQFRLFPDMFPLTAQVQLACDFAARASARLAGITPRKFEDTESSFAELQARIALARDYIASFDPALYEEAGERVVTFPSAGREMQMAGRDYLSLYAVPQFYFHLTTAYNILRHNGIEVGKADFMGVAA